jgi:hypothetical protein
MRLRFCPCVCVYIPLIVARQRLGKSPLIIDRQQLYFLYGPCRIKGKSAIISSQKLLFLRRWFS